MQDSFCTCQSMFTMWRGIKCRWDSSPHPTAYFCWWLVVYADVYNDSRVCIEQTVAAGIKTIFILLRTSDLDKRQDSILFDKMEAMIWSPIWKTSRTNCCTPAALLPTSLMLICARLSTFSNLSITNVNRLWWRKWRPSQVCSSLLLAQCLGLSPPSLAFTRPLLPLLTTI